MQICPRYSDQASDFKLATECGWQARSGAESCTMWLYAAFLCCALAFAQRARWAAAIRLRPAADIVRRGFAFCFAQRAFCAKLILRRADGS